MSEIVTHSHRATYVPRNWRLFAAAGAAGLGLVCGLIQSADADVLKPRKPQKPPVRLPAAAAKNSTPENGFVATIRRLMADSQAYAEKGDFVKAIQMADRAAKISEASAQLLGPSTECSPEETAKFAAEMRSRQEAFARSRETSIPIVQAEQPIKQTTKPSNPPVDSSPKNVVAKPSVPRQQVPTIASTQFEQAAATPSSTVGSASIQNSRTSVTPPTQRQTQSAPSASNQQPRQSTPTQTVAVEMGRSTISSASRTNLSSSAQVVQTLPPAVREPEPQESHVPPAPRSDEPLHAMKPSLDQLLTDARRCARRGEIEEAIQLAEQVAELSEPELAMFGPSTPKRTATYHEAVNLIRDLEQRKSLTEFLESNPVAQAEQIQAGPSDPIAEQSPVEEQIQAELQNSPEMAATTTTKESPVEIPYRPLKLRGKATIIPSFDENLLESDEMVMGAMPSVSPARESTRDTTIESPSDLPSISVNEVALDLTSPQQAETTIAIDNSTPEEASIPVALPKSDGFIRVEDPNSAELPASPTWAEDDLPPAPAPEVTSTRRPLRFARTSIQQSHAAELQETFHPPTPTPRSQPNPTPIRLRRSGVIQTSAMTSEQSESPNFTVTPAVAETVTTEQSEEPATNVRSHEQNTQKTDPVKEQRPAIRLRRNKANSGQLETPSAAAGAATLPQLDRVESRIDESNNRIQLASYQMDEPTASAEAPLPPSPPVAKRPAMRLRGGVIVHAVAHEAPGSESQIQQTGDWESVPVDPKPAQAAPPVKPIVPPKKPNSQTLPSEKVIQPTTDVEIPVQRFPVQRVMEMRQRIESAASLNPGGWHEGQQGSPTAAPSISGAKVIKGQGADLMEPATDERNNFKPVERRDGRGASQGASWVADDEFKPVKTTPPSAPAVRPAGVKLRNRSTISLVDPSGGANATIVPKPAPKSRQASVGHSEFVGWKSIEGDAKTTNPAADTEQQSKTIFSSLAEVDQPFESDSEAIQSNDPERRESSTRRHTADIRETNREVMLPPMKPPVEQVRFESEGNTSRESLFSEVRGNRSVEKKRSEESWYGDDSGSPQMAPPPPTDDVSPTLSWIPGGSESEETESKPLDNAIRKTSFTSIDQLAAFLKLPVPTAISILGCAAAALLGFGLMSLRLAFKSRHSD